MKILFQSCLYITVGFCSIFTAIWFFTGGYRFDNKAFAEEKNVKPKSLPAKPSASAKPPAPTTVSNSNSALPAPSVPPSLAANSENAPLKPAPAVPPAPLPATNSENAPPQPTVPSVPPVSSPEPIANSENAPPKPTVPSVPPVSSPEPIANSENAPSKPSPSAVPPILPADKSAGMKADNFKNPTLKATKKNLEGANKKIQNVHSMLRSYQYDAGNRRDPFKSAIPPAEQKSAKKISIPTYPTGKYELNKIKLIGIKWGSGLGSSKALFKTPDNVVHTLQKNDRIGLNRGVIYQLREDEVVIMQPQSSDFSSETSEDLFIPIVIRMERWASKK